MSRVLVVNDEPELLETCKLVLEIDGQEVATCGSLAELRDILANFQPEVIVLDWIMGGHRSDKVLPIIRNAMPDAPVLVITGSPGIEPEARRLGAAALLNKPFDATAFTGEVSRLLAANNHAPH